MFQNGGKPVQSVHALALALVGGYLIYMAVKMITNVQKGLSSMDLTTAIILAAIMGLAGAAVAGYGLYLGIRSGKQREEK